MFKKFLSFFKKPSVEPEEEKSLAKPVVSKETEKKELELIKILEDIHRRENELTKRVQVLDQKELYLHKKEEDLSQKERNITRVRQEAEELRRKQQKRLEEIANLPLETAQKKVIGEAEKSLTGWLAKKIRETQENLKSQEEEMAKEVLAEALRHGVTDFVAEYTISTIPLEDENLKGKIIGREGRNIRVFERATGVELELEEEREVRISSFDPLRREIAKISLQKLIRDGRIQPSRIEEVVAQTKSQMDRVLLEEGKKICQEVGVYSLPVDIVKTIGRFKYRFSYGQNLAVHTVEVTKIGVKIAYELKADVKTVRLAGLLHDVGKVITDEEGGHIQVGVDFLKKFNLPQSIIDCVGEHHEDKGFSSIESAIIWVADAASGSRPGARYQIHEEYLKRMSEIEEKVRSFEGVDDVAAYQAGREIRVIVSPEKISDDELVILTHKIAEKLDEEAKWAGQIKITAIRENRATAVAPLRH
jgi:ribonuclease Y